MDIHVLRKRGSTILAIARACRPDRKIVRAYLNGARTVGEGAQAARTRQRSSDKFPLRGVPRTATGRAQPVHHRHRIEQPAAHQVRLAAHSPAFDGTTCKLTGSQTPKRGFTEMSCPAAKGCSASQANANVTRWPSC